jgi:hypothetical protein
MRAASTSGRPAFPEGTAELIGWDGIQVAAILTGQDGVGSSCLINPTDGTTIVLDRRSGGKLVDSRAGASLVRVGPCGYRDLILLHGLTEIAPLPSDPGATTDTGVILDDHELLDRLSSLLRVEALTAPMLLVQQLGRRVECLIFDEEGHAIVKRENRAVLVAAIGEWFAEAFTTTTSLQYGEDGPHPRTGS